MTQRDRSAGIRAGRSTASWTRATHNSSVLLALVVCTLCTLSTLSHAQRVTSGLKVLYQFTEGQQFGAATTVVNDKSSTPGVVLGNIQLNGIGKWNTDSIGINFPTPRVSSPTVQSSRNNTDLISTWGSSGFTVEAWLQGGVTSSSQFVLGFGNYSATEVFAPRCPATNMGGWRMIWTGSRYTSEVREGTDCLDAAGALEPVPSTPAVTHMTLTYSAGSLISYTRSIRTSGSVNQAIAFNINLFQPNSALLLGRSFPNPVPLPATQYGGKIFHLAFYDRAISAAEVTQNYDAWMPNSRPFLSSTARGVALLQDAYSFFDLPVDDFDNTWAPPAVARQTITFNITTLPAVDRGTLYFLKTGVCPVPSNVTAACWGTIDPLGLPFTLPAGLKTVAFKSVKYDNGPNFASFRYQAFDGIAWSELQGVISINVTAVNHPPEVFSSTQSGFADSYTVLTLAGQDFDKADSIQSATVKTTPLTGTLFTTTDGVTPGTAIVAPFTVTHPNQWVLYRGPGATASAVDVQGFTTFTYSVKDSLGSESLTDATVTVNIRNNLQPTSNGTVSPEETRVRVTLAGVDKAGGVVSVVVARNPTKGKLYTINTTTEIVPPAVVPGGQVDYIPNFNLYGLPLDSLIFYVQNSTGFKSANGTHTFNVTFVNHPPMVNASTKSLTAVANDNPDAIASIFSVNLTDPDTIYPEKTSQFYSVTVRAIGVGTSVSINQSIITAPASSIVFRVGDGTTDTLMVFDAPFAQAVVALRYIVFHAAVRLERAIVEISVQDNDANTGPFTTTEQVFAVVEKNPNSVASDGAILPMPYLVLAWIAIIGCPVTSCICYCWYRHKRWKDTR